MIAQKFDIKEIEIALAYLKKHTNTVSVKIKFDDHNRLLISADDISANEIKITLYANGPEGKMAEVSKTSQLSEKVTATITERLTNG